MRKMESISYKELGHTVSHYDGATAVSPAYTPRDLTHGRFDLSVAMFGYEIDEEGATLIRDQLNNFLKDVVTNAKAKKNGA